MKRDLEGGPIDGAAKPEMPIDRRPRLLLAGLAFIAMVLAGMALGGPVEEVSYAIAASLAAAVIYLVWTRPLPPATERLVSVVLVVLSIVFVLMITTRSDDPDPDTRPAPGCEILYQKQVGLAAAGHHIETLQDHEQRGIPVSSPGMIRYVSVQVHRLSPQGHNADSPPLAPDVEQRVEIELRARGQLLDAHTAVVTEREPVEWHPAVPVDPQSHPELTLRVRNPSPRAVHVGWARENNRRGQLVSGNDAPQPLFDLAARIDLCKE